jgi:hypothetical protein
MGIMFERMLFSLARHFLWGGTKFFFGIGYGPSPGQNQTATDLTGIGSGATSAGFSDTSQASDFWSAILSGDMSKISSVLGPEFGAIQSQAQQSIDTAGQFGNRSGGTNAAIQNTTNTTRANESNLIGNLTGQAASQLGTLGTNLLNTGLSATEGAFSADTTLHTENQSMWNDIFNSIGQVVSGAAGGFSGGAGGGGITDAANLDASASGGYGPGNVANSDLALPPSGSYGFGSLPGQTGFSLPPGYEQWGY